MKEPPAHASEAGIDRNMDVSLLSQIGQFRQPDVARSPASTERATRRFALTFTWKAAAWAQPESRTPVVLCWTRLRRHVRRLIEQAMPTMAVSCYNEIAPGIRADTIGVVNT